MDMQTLINESELYKYYLQNKGNPYFLVNVFKLEFINNYKDDILYLYYLIGITKDINNIISEHFKNTKYDILLLQANVIYNNSCPLYEALHNRKLNEENLLQLINLTSNDTISNSYEEYKIDNIEITNILLLSILKKSSDNVINKIVTKTNNNILNESSFLKFNDNSNDGYESRIILYRYLYNVINYMYDNKKFDEELVSENIIRMIPNTKIDDIINIFNVLTTNYINKIYYFNDLITYIKNNTIYGNTLFGIIALLNSDIINDRRKYYENLLGLIYDWDEMRVFLIKIINNQIFTNDEKENKKIIEYSKFYNYCFKNLISYNLQIFEEYIMDLFDIIEKDENRVNGFESLISYIDDYDKMNNNDKKIFINNVKILVANEYIVSLNFQYLIKYNYKYLEYMNIITKNNQEIYNYLITDEWINENYKNKIKLLKYHITNIPNNVLMSYKDFMVSSVRDDSGQCIYTNFNSYKYYIRNKYYNDNTELSNVIKINELLNKLKLSINFDLISVYAMTTYNDIMEGYTYIDNLSNIKN